MKHNVSRFEEKEGTTEVLIKWWTHHVQKRDFWIIWELFFYFGLWSKSRPPPKKLHVLNQVILDLIVYPVVSEWCTEHCTVLWTCTALHCTVGSCGLHSGQGRAQAWTPGLDTSTEEFGWKGHHFVTKYFVLFALSKMSHKVFCPLCKQTMTANSEAECIEHMSTCPGFAQKHGEQPRKKRAADRLTKLPSAADAARPENRTREYSNDGTFVEKIPEALLDALHWWKDETQAKESDKVTTKTTKTKTKTKTKTTSTPWIQDDGTDRFYWHKLLQHKPQFVSVFASNGGAPSHLIQDVTVNVSQTAREQCGVDNFCTFSSQKCVLCGLAAKFKKSRCSRCKRVHYCSNRCQKMHWKTHSKECAPENGGKKV